MAQMFGRATITVNGVTFDTKPGASIDTGGITRSAETSDQQTNYSESLRPAIVRCDVSFNRGDSLVSLNDIVGATVQFICDTGQQYVLSDAFRTDELAATGGSNGGYSLVLQTDAANCVEVSV